MVPPMGVLSMQRSVGNQSIMRSLASGRIQRDNPSPAPPSAAPATPDPAMKAKEDGALAKLSGLKGNVVAGFNYDNPMTARYVPPNPPPPIASLTLGEVVARPTGPDQPRQSFDTQAEAIAHATIMGGPAGAVVLKSDGLFFAGSLSASAGSEFLRDRMYRFLPMAGSVMVGVTLDRAVVVTGKDYQPDGAKAGKVDRPEDVTAPVASAEELRKILGVGGKVEPGQATPKTPAAVTVPPGQEEAVIKTYLMARAMETLQQNRAMTIKLASDFKPEAGGKIGGDAKRLIDESRAMGILYEELEGKEARVGEEAHKILDKSRDQKSRIGYKGQRKFAFEWFDDLGLQIKAIGEGKRSALQLSPVLASMVRHDKTPDTAKGWAEKLDAEAASAKVAKVAGSMAPALAVANPIGALVGWGAAKLGGVIANSAHDTKTWKDSELSKKSSAESDEKIAAEMRTKLDGVQQAISRTIGRVAGGDVGYLLGLSGLRARVEADISKLGPQNKAVQEKFKEMLLHNEMVDDLIEVAGTVVQVGALFLPGGQFISAAIGLGMEMKKMSTHLEQWDASKAAVDPANALADQQELTKTLLFDSITLAVQAIDMASNVGHGLDALEQGGKSLKAPTTGEANDPSGKRPDDVPPGPPGAVPDPKATQGSVSPGYRDKLKDAGVPGGNPYAPINARSVLEKNGKSWVTAKSNFLQVPVEAADKLGGDYVMHQLMTFRQSEAMGRLERLCAKAEADTGIPHRIEAVGSTARTSDLDFSISGPNSHAVVAQFNAEFRASWGAESGVVLDTNIYTRSAHLDYPLTPKPGDVAGEARIRIVPQQAGANAATSGGKEAWASFEQKTLAGATSGAEKTRLQQVLKEAEKQFPDDLRARLRYMDNFKQQSASHVKAYENAMAHGLPEGPLQWKSYCDQALQGTSGAQKAAVAAELEQAAATGARNETRVLEALKQKYPDEVWTPERLHKMAHSDNAAELDKLMNVRNRMYESELDELAKLKAQYNDPALSEAQRLEIAARINAKQTDALGFASEAYLTQGSILNVVQNAQKAKMDLTSPHYGQLVANQSRAAMNEQLGAALGYGSDWPNVIKAGKYLERADQALEAHPLVGKGGGKLTGNVKSAMSELGALKEEGIKSPKLQEWAKKNYPSAGSVEDALAAHRAAMEKAAGQVRAEMNRVAGTPMTIFDAKWAEIAKDPAKLGLVLAALRLATSGAAPDR